jgi:hypothetical protein
MKKKADIHVRLDAETHATITEAAHKNGRSLNEEIIFRLHGSRPERVTELLEANNREVERRREAEEEAAYWRREMLAKLEMLSALYASVTDEDRRAEIAIQMRPIFGAFTEAQLKQWHDICAGCGAFIRPGDAYADYGEDFGRVCIACTDPGDCLRTAEKLDEKAIIAKAVALLKYGAYE